MKAFSGNVEAISDEEDDLSFGRNPEDLPGNGTVARNKYIRIQAVWDDSTRKRRQERAALHLFFQPVAWCNNLQLSVPEPRVTFPFASPYLMRQVRIIPRPELRTGSALLGKSSATVIVETASGNGIHPV